MPTRDDRSLGFIAALLYVLTCRQPSQPPSTGLPSLSLHCSRSLRGSSSVRRMWLRMADLKRKPHHFPPEPSAPRWSCSG